MIWIKWWLASLQDMDEVKNILIRNLEHFSQVRKSVVTSHCLSELKKVSSQIQLYWPQHLLIQISTQILSTLLWLDSLAVPSWPRLSDPQYYPRHSNFPNMPSERLLLPRFSHQPPKLLLIKWIHSIWIPI